MNPASPRLVAADRSREIDAGFLTTCNVLADVNLICRYMRSRVKSNNIAYDHLIEGFSVNSSLYGSSLLLSEEASAPTTPAAATGNEESTAPPNWLLDEVRTYPLIISISSSVPSSLVLM